VQVAPQDHLSEAKKERLDKFLGQLEQMITTDAEFYREATTVEHLIALLDEKLGKMANLQKMIT